MFDTSKFRMNPHYGGGAFRRRIRLTRDGSETDGTVHGALEDCNHGFQTTVMYANGEITSIEPRFERVPFSTCDGSTVPLKQLIGISVACSPRELLAAAPPRANCTHLQDLTLLAIAQTQREAATTQFDIEITDEKQELSDMRIWRSDDDGEKRLMLHWRGGQGKLAWPKAAAGNPLLAGFTQWATALYEGAELEAAFALQKGYLVSLGRMLDVDGMAGGYAIDENHANTCFTYSPENARRAIRQPDITRDFTDTPEQLLRFL